MPRRRRFRGETAAILPSDTRPKRTEPMTDEEFRAALDRERRELIAAGKPLWRETT